MNVEIHIYQEREHGEKERLWVIFSYYNCNLNGCLRYKYVRMRSLLLQTKSFPISKVGFKFKSEKQVPSEGCHLKQFNDNSYFSV